jgi:hypothetical protein
VTKSTTAKQVFIRGGIWICSGGTLTSSAFCREAKKFESHASQSFWTQQTPNIHLMQITKFV